MEDAPRFIIVEDDQAVQETYTAAAEIAFCDQYPNLIVSIYDNLQSFSNDLRKLAEQGTLASIIGIATDLEFPKDNSTATTEELGFDVVSQAREALGQRVPIVMTSGTHNPNQAQLKALELGATAFLRKPTSIADFISSITKAQV